MKLLYKNIALFIGPMLSLAVFACLKVLGFSSVASITASVTMLCAVWWIFETIPIAATALIPVAVFPLLGVLPASSVGQAYGSPIVLLMLGGFMLSSAMEKSGAHKRLAVMTIKTFGGDRCSKLVAGFMFSAAFLSMWISNTATALMLLPIALAILKPIGNHRLNVSVMLGVAYACSLGGTITPIGTPTNLIFMQVYAETTGSEISFSSWILIALPVSLVMLPLIWWWLIQELPESLHADLPQVGAWRAEEKRMMTVFGITAFLWVTRKEPFGGWSQWLTLPYANDASIALLAAIAMFLVSDGKKGRLLDWDNAQKIPWGILILFGSGICIARAFSATGLSEVVGGALSGISVLPLIVATALLCLSVTFLTEVTSNTATAVLLMPILAATAVSIGIDPAFLMVPAVISCSCAFMLPVATPPNAVAYSSKLFSLSTMARIGLMLNFMGVFVVSGITYLSLSLVID